MMESRHVTRGGERTGKKRKESKTRNRRGKRIQRRRGRNPKGEKINQANTAKLPKRESRERKYSVDKLKESRILKQERMNCY
jgi:hypothetical protein